MHRADRTTPDRPRVSAAGSATATASAAAAALRCLLANHPLVPPRREQRRQNRGDDDRCGDLHRCGFCDRRVGCVGDARPPVGTAAELPAVLDAAAPAMPLPPSSLSARMQTKPVTTTTVMPRTTPGAPAVTTDLQIDRLAERERHERDDDRFVRAEELLDVVVEVAEHRAGENRRNHRQHRQPRNDGQARAHENQHRQERTGLDALNDVGA